MSTINTISASITNSKLYYHTLYTDAEPQSYEGPEASSSEPSTTAETIPTHYASGRPYRASKRRTNAIGYCCDTQVTEAEKSNSKTVVKCLASGCETVWVCIAIPLNLPSTFN